MTIQATKQLLKQVDTITKHHKEMMFLKGEHFNIFSILGMESAENKTHSAFIGELLNPKGSHLMGTIFLELFIDQVGLPEDFEIKTASLTIEKYIGPRDDVAKSGGRIDIYLADGAGRTISIENKIYAGDQNTQIERYCSHNRKKNTVFYLTLEGDEASNASRGNLKASEEYHPISYEVDILEWLLACQKEAVQHETIRDSIGQYINLIKKLTHQLSNHQMKEETNKLIAQNYESAQHIAGQIEEVEKEAIETFFEDVGKRVVDVLGEDWKYLLDDINRGYAGLEIWSSKDSFPKNCTIRIEGQSKLWKSPAVIGIRANKKDCDRAELSVRLGSIDFFDGSQKTNHWWYGYIHYAGFNDAKNRADLFDKVKRIALTDKFVNDLILLANECI
jgi:hypothetical protein